MSEPVFQFNSALKAERLNYQNVYPCPVCRYGELSALTLMDAFGCNFCRHILSANLDRQVVEMVDSTQSLQWFWNGKGWQGLPRNDGEFGWEIWILALSFVLFPPLLVGSCCYLFPPLPGSALSWVPIFWTGLTFFAHFTCVVWLIMEYYQFPLAAFLRSWSRYFLGR